MKQKIRKTKPKKLNNKIKDDKSIEYQYVF